MKLIITLFAALSVIASADTIYLDNDTSHPADFHTFQEAHDAATEGDTIIVAPSAVSYGDVTITKRLIIRGNGVGALELQTVSADVGLSRFGFICVGQETDRSIAAGTLIEGIEIESSCTILANQTGIRRSRGRLFISGGTCFVDQCLAVNLRIGSSDDEISINVSIRNSVIGLLDNNGGSQQLVVDSTARVTVDYCYLTSASIPGPSLGTLGVFTNSIIGSTTGIRSSVFSNCLSLSDSVGMSGNGNIVDTAENTFINPNQVISLGSEFQILKPDSPAFTAASDGGQVGIFGGDRPFIVGSFPPIPRITELKVRSASNVSGITFEVKAEAQR